MIDVNANERDFASKERMNEILAKRCICIGDEIAKMDADKRKYLGEVMADFIYISNDSVEAADDYDKGIFIGRSQALVHLEQSVKYINNDFELFDEKRPVFGMLIGDLKGSDMTKEKRQSLNINLLSAKQEPLSRESIDKMYEVVAKISPYISLPVSDDQGQALMKIDEEHADLVNEAVNEFNKFINTLSNYHAKQLRNLFDIHIVGSIKERMDSQKAE